MEFRTTLRKFGPNNTGIEVPEEVVAALGNGRRRFKVVVTVDGHTYRSSVAPYAGLLLIPFSAERRDVIWEKYVKGESTIATKQEDEKVKVKGAN